MLQGDSADNAISSFQRIRECFFAKLNNYIDNATIYTSNGPSNKAIDWLMEDSLGFSNCDSDSFVQRYALTAIHFASLLSNDNGHDDASITIAPTNDGSDIDDASMTIVPTYNGSDIDDASLTISPTYEATMILSVERECVWPTVVCIDGNVEELNLRYQDLFGSIATEIGLLRNLTKVDMGK